MSAKFWIILLLALVFGWGLYADYSLEIARFFAGKSIEGVGTAGSWGDTFGAFNGLVSLAGALFVVRTLVLQQAALAEQQRALALQAEDAHRQRFEATFFELLKLMRELRGELVFKHSKQFISAAQNPKTKQHRLETKVGIDALTGFTLEHLFHIRQAVTNPPTASRDEIVAAYEKTMTMNTERTFAPYYRLVYSILNKVRHDSILRDQEKASYTRLLRSQLTNSELVSLAYNALSPRSADLESLLTDYHMLKYLPKSGARIRFEGIFDKQAFAARD